MPVDNFENIHHLLRFDDPDKFYFIQIFKRRKDNPEMEKDMIVVDSFYIYSMSEFEKHRKRIINICESNNSRAYIRLNRRSDKKIALQMLARIATMISSNQYNVRGLYNSIAGEFHAEDDKTWIVDVDFDRLEETTDETRGEKINEVVTFIQSLIYKTKRDDTVYGMPTKNGIHFICRPFNLQEFKENPVSSLVDIHRDNPTILYTP
jgi:hypothetical protein